MKSRRRIDFSPPQINWQLCSIAFVNIINEEARDLLGEKGSGVDKEHTTISYPREIFNVSFSYFILSRARINRIVWISLRNFTYTSVIFIRLLKLRSNAIKCDLLHKNGETYSKPRCFSIRLNYDLFFVFSCSRIHLEFGIVY